jgi:hypothetical protein
MFYEEGEVAIRTESLRLLVGEKNVREVCRGVDPACRVVEAESLSPDVAGELIVEGIGETSRRTGRRFLVGTVRAMIDYLTFDEPGFDHRNSLCFSMYSQNWV